MAQEAQPGEKIQAAGETMKGCGCILFLLPIFVICCAFLVSAVLSMFHG